MRGRFWRGVLAAWLLSSSTSVAVADRALDKPAFAASPSELLALAAAAPAGDWPVVILRDQRDVSFDDQNRATVRRRSVIVVRTEAGAEGWATLRTEWRSFYQDRPAVRARVIGPSGEVAEIDPAQVSDAPVIQVGSYASSDRRRLEARLPRLQVGAVIEQEIVTIDREPILSAGTVDIASIGGDVPTASTVISYSAPAAKKIHRIERKLPAGAHVRREVSGGRQSWIYRIGPLAAHGPIEPDVPGDVVVHPYIGAGTAASWTAVARAYRALIDLSIAREPVNLPADIPRIASIDTVNAIMAWIRRRVRYNWFAFDQSSNVPLPPAETLRRRLGDCKDLVTLTVALLREAGIRADVVLLDAGPGLDLDPDLPGMAAFDHAIVRARLDTRDVWIDAAEELTRPGHLPARVQGRRALVIADDTQGLTATPRAAPSDHGMRVVRTFVAAEAGRSQATEVSHPTGMLESGHRLWVRVTAADKVRTHYDDHVERTYSGTLVDVTPGAAEDLTTPFETAIAIKDVPTVYTDPWQLDIYLRPNAVLAELPSVVTDRAATSRTHDFAWPIPHTYEVENRIVFPHGFSLPSPSERVRSLGPTKLTERRRVDGQTLIVTFRFETGKPRLTPRELAALREGVRAVYDEQLRITIEHTATALARAGKPREAIAECERLIALHPDEPAHHAQLARVLLDAGAGEAARRSARKAVEFGAAHPEAFAVLGWTLSHDTFGRRFKYDWDRAGAIAAYQKARALDPAHLGVLSALGDLHAVDPYGRAFERGSDLRAAIEVRRAAFAIRRDDEAAHLLAGLLSWNGQFSEAEEVARTAKPNDIRDRLIVLAVAATKGGEAAIQVAGQLQSGAARTKLIEQAAWWALYVRRYDAARAMFAEAGTWAKPTAFSAVLDRLTAQPAVKPGTADPRSAVLDVLEALVHHERKTPVFWDTPHERSTRRRLARLAPTAAPGGGQLDHHDDLVRSATIQLDGEAGAWRASVDVVGQRAQLYLVLDAGIVKLVGAPEAAASIGRYVLATLQDASAEKRARRLLDWLRSDLEQASWIPWPTFKAVWGDGLPSSRDAILLAAAVLAGTTDLDRAMAVASRCPSALPAGRYECHDLLVRGYLAKERWTDALAQAEKTAQLPRELLPAERAVALVREHAWLLARTGKLDAADKLLDDLLAKGPASREDLEARMDAAIAAGHMKEAVERADAMLGHPGATPADLNDVAWLRLGANEDLAKALELARKAVEAAPRSPGFVNTLAAIEAEVGDLDRARADNWKSMELAGSIEPTDYDRYVAGRILEQLGLTSDARAMYQRIARSGYRGVTSYTLAQRRLAAMGQARGRSK